MAYILDFPPRPGCVASRHVWGKRAQPGDRCACGVHVLRIVQTDDELAMTLHAIGRPDVLTHDLVAS